MARKSVSSKYVRCACAALAVLLFCARSACADPLSVLENRYPALYKLYQTYPQYRQQLSDYADMQGFTRPYEHLATIVHELIHIDSYVHQGFFIDGVYYAPYMKPGAWGSLTNKDVLPYLEPSIVRDEYVRNTPANNLGNIVDEMNAYGHVIGFVCDNEPDGCDRQIANGEDFLMVADKYEKHLTEDISTEAVLAEKVVYQRLKKQISSHFR